MCTFPAPSLLPPGSPLLLPSPALPPPPIIYGGPPSILTIGSWQLEHRDFLQPSILCGHLRALLESQTHWVLTHSVWSETVYEVSPRLCLLIYKMETVLQVSGCQWEGVRSLTLVPCNILPRSHDHALPPLPTHEETETLGNPKTCPGTHSITQVHKPPALVKREQAHAAECCQASRRGSKLWCVRAHLSGCRSQPCCLPAVCPQASYLTCLFLSFLIFKMGLMMLPCIELHRGLNEVLCAEYLEQHWSTAC